jgi:hypothetical protein
MCRMSWKSGSLNLEPSGPHRACYGMALPLHSLTFAHWRNRLTTHFSEHIPVLKRRMTVYVQYRTCTLLILWNQNSLLHWHCLWSTETYTSLLLINCGRDAGSDEPRVLNVSTHWLIDWLIDWFAGWKKSETAVWQSSGYATIARPFLFLTTEVRT